MNANIFHDHLDTCSHCNDHPFALCHEGIKALREAARAAVEDDLAAKLVNGCCNGSDPDCPTHGIAASNARQNEFYRRHPRG